MPEFVIWFLTWVAASLLFLSIPATVLFVGAYRQVRRAGVPHPAMVVASRATSLLHPRIPASPADITTERVFVEWDVRWLASGHASAIATRSDSHVSLVFESPQEIGESGTSFSFIPRYRRGAAIYGVISSGDDVQGTAVVRPLGV